MKLSVKGDDVIKKDWLKLEKAYLEKTVKIIKDRLEREQDSMAGKKKDLVATRADMYENTAKTPNDIGRLTEMVQHLTPMQIQTSDYKQTTKRITKYEKLLKSPYFARIDFIEEGYDKESIYIGIGNLEDNNDIYVYDWRVPISSIFYRYELGEACYQAPSGIIKGKVTLKLQYEIKDGQLEYFFDSNVSVMDNILKKALSSNTSSKMKNIVETIQREQDKIIRDIENDLIIVQGVAGSGKTSIALHRVAFLLYQGLKEKLSHNNIILISPNFLFGEYIENVLPELGEENITSCTFEDIFSTALQNTVTIKSRDSLLESIITCKSENHKQLLKSNLNFKLSKTFTTILERFIKHYEYKAIGFKDIQFDGQIIANRHLLKMDFLKRQKSSVSIEKRLKHTETKILNKILELRKNRLSKIEKIVYEKHPFDSKAFARLMHTKQSKSLIRDIYSFTRIDYLSLYRTLFQDKELFLRLASGLNLPPNIIEILNFSNKRLAENSLHYEDGIALLYLNLKIAGCSAYSNIKQVVVDEAQDYHPIHYEILKILFPDARYTVTGDINQTIEKKANLSIYDDIKRILDKPKASTAYINKSFRCSHEIIAFSQKFIENDISIESFDRHSIPPKVVHRPTVNQLINAMLEDIDNSKNLGYSSIAIICKSMKQAIKLYNSIKERIDVHLIDKDTPYTLTGILVVPIYMAKGLEFDAVIVADTDDNNYKTSDDKNLLYIACTRALHKLSLYYTGNKSKFLQ
ncbi:UvrD-helicase domain-containing protein [Proteinivorax tanatarense]|uniref:UvrD-helicase domain-containing protein n=1 Tax=Proteinivorax tanatarense TaxID=1260629 RepID=A0AAU7VKW4_9FIRM